MLKDPDFSQTCATDMRYIGLLQNNKNNIEIHQLLIKKDTSMDSILAKIVSKNEIFLKKIASKNLLEK